MGVKGWVMGLALIGALANDSFRVCPVRVPNGPSISGTEIVVHSQGDLRRGQRGVRKDPARSAAFFWKRGGQEKVITLGPI